MSLSSDRGKLFERKVQKLTAKILKLEVKRDSRSGAGESYKMDIRDRYNEIPLFIECKDQEKANIKADWRKANAQASFGQAPVVVFPDNEEILCTMRYSDLLQFIKEASDYRKSYELLKGSGVDISPGAEGFTDSVGGGYTIGIDPAKPGDDKTVEAHVVIGKKIKKKLQENHLKTCRAGHISDQWGYCMAKKCPYSRGYKKPKEKKK